MTRATNLGRPVRFDEARNSTLKQAAGRFHPDYRGALERLPAGRQVFHGLPFELGPDGRSPRWILPDGLVVIDLTNVSANTGAARYLVIAHLCDAWRDDHGRRPAGLAVGHVVPVGELLARYTVIGRDGSRQSRLIRRRFEIADGVLGWGSSAFGAVSHIENEVVDWRGPHPRQEPGRYAPPGQSGSLTIMPGMYGMAQTGVTDFVPSATNDALLWLFTFELAQGAEPAALEIEPLAGGRPGSDLLIAGVTLFDGSSHPLARGPRFQARVEGLDAAESAADRLTVDLGTVIRTRPAPRSEAAPRIGSHSRDLLGWGTPRRGSADSLADGPAGHPTDGPAGALIVDLALTPDARIEIDGWAVTGRDLLTGAIQRDASGHRSIEVLPAANVPVEVEVVDQATAERIPARVRFTTSDGRYLPPSGHRDEVNPGFFEDTGADLVLGSATYAYVPGRFEIALPPGEVEVEVVGGFDRRPYRTRLTIGPDTNRIELPLERAIDLHAGRWVTADSHVHFLAPSTALLQAAAEDVDLVNLLAAQWGDLFTNLTDLPWGSMSDPAGRRVVVVGTENRQNMLGHLALLGAHRPTTPLASGGPPEGRLAGALDALLADWADRCRAAGGLVVAAHFPLPYAEIAADIVTGRIDALESQALSPGLDDPAILEWYRFLNLGYRLPIVAGTDKMSSEVPIGAVRTYTHLLDDEPLSFDRWAAAVRAGRTFVSSGPVLELRVEGREPGDVISLPSAGRLAVEVRVRASQPVIDELELLVNGRIVASTGSPGTSAGPGGGTDARPASGSAAGPGGRSESSRLGRGTSVGSGNPPAKPRSPSGSTELRLDETVEISAGSWIAARSRSRRVIESAFTTTMAAHTSPVYVEVADSPFVPAEADAAAVEQVIEGARMWVAELAPVATPTERARMVAFFDSSLETLRRRMLRPD